MYKVKLLEVELTGHCNAACPQCIRNIYGGKTSSDVPLDSWNIDKFKQHIPKKMLRSIQTLYFCGTYGDPLACKDIVKIAKYARETAPNLTIGIHTNGGLRSPYIFRQLAPYVTFIAFGIDGLEDTNHLYRRNVRFDKVMQNARAFIQAGGTAYWDFIVFKHNQHQVELARATSKELGFKKFNYKKTSRFFNKKHELVDSLDVQDEQGNYEYTIRPPTNTEYYNETLDNWRGIDIKKFTKQTTIKCQACKDGAITIGCEGSVNICGWIYDRFYGYESSKTSDRARLKSIQNNIGIEQTNIFETPLQQILDGPWFRSIAETWDSDNKLERCAVMCGKINLIGGQNQEVDYLHKDIV